MSQTTIAAVTRLVLVAELIADLEQLARHSPEKIEQLAASMAAEGQLQPIGIRADKRIIFGHGRFLGAKRLGWTEIEARVFPESLTETQWRIIRITENLQRTDISAFDRWRQCAELLALNPTWLDKDLADHLKLGASQISRILALSKCVLPVREAAQAGLLDIAAWTAISKAEEKDQFDLLNAVLSGEAKSRDDLERKRKARNATPVGKVSNLKLRCPLPSGAVVQVRLVGDGGIEEAIEAVQEWLKFAKRGVERGWDAKTLERTFVAEAKAVKS